MIRELASRHSRPPRRRFIEVKHRWLPPILPNVQNIALDYQDATRDHCFTAYQAGPVYLLIRLRLFQFGFRPYHSSHCLETTARPRPSIPSCRSHVAPNHSENLVLRRYPHRLQPRHPGIAGGRYALGHRPTPVKFWLPARLGPVTNSVIRAKSIPPYFALQNREYVEFSSAGPNYWRISISQSAIG
jgi:hypothetical protein